MVTGTAPGDRAPAGTLLRVPSVESARTWLAGCDDALVRCRSALLGTPSAGPGPHALRQELAVRVTRHPAVVSALGRQWPDGSWGPTADSRRRLLPTLWMTKALTELGLDSTSPAWRRAVGFLASNGHTPDGVFSISGHRTGVLSCYVGIAAATYLSGGRPDLAAPQVAWLLAYQDVRVHGCSLRPDVVGQFSPHLRTRYGGCLASTTCLVGLVKAGVALELWRRARPPGERAGPTEPLLGAIREAFLARSLFRRGDGSVLPLGTTPERADQWLLPSFPLDWRTDLVEVVGLVARTGPPDVRLQPALDTLAEQQLPDGSWPLRRSFRPADLPVIDRSSSRRGSPWVTLRVVDALSDLVSAGAGPRTTPTSPRTASGSGGPRPT